ncbi:hypothetical protein [Kozakia baliensis]|uniref:Uncharacterized protein n=1 Tax=Kozakia baliensis TaxID=153496 RepID=A0A1D8UV63_9PROT|nr:hypothetical protein [Kozakia baliensis]AOX17531.1 hypothetical protein A0U89_10680 [Kozakia baliensis]GEL62998.1 hypothetical protein KBA01_02840 [Kozakia baliensis]
MIVVDFLSVLLGVGFGALLGYGLHCTLPRGLPLAFGLLVLIPALTLAFVLPLVFRESATLFLSFCQGFLIAPAALLPLAVKLDRVPPGLTRAGAGLGADSAMRVRLIWVPLLGPAATATGIAIVLLGVFCLAAQHR